MKAGPAARTLRPVPSVLMTHSAGFLPARWKAMVPATADPAAGVALVLAAGELAGVELLLVPLPHAASTAGTTSSRPSAARVRTTVFLMMPSAVGEKETPLRAGPEARAVMGPAPPCTIAPLWGANLPSRSAEVAGRRRRSCTHSPGEPVRRWPQFPSGSR